MLCCDRKLSLANCSCAPQWTHGPTRIDGRPAVSEVQGIDTKISGVVFFPEVLPTRRSGARMTLSFEGTEDG